MVHRRELEGTAVVFGNQGDLYGNAMTWWDHDTGSVWSQPTGEAILGPRKGQRLELLPSTLTTWEAWMAAHPETLALEARGWATGFHLADMAIVVDLGSEAVAYEITALRESGVVNDTVAGVDIAVVIDPQDEARWVVFGRVLDGLLMEFETTPAGLLDQVSGTVFDPFLGVGMSGLLKGEALSRIPGFTAFPEDFRTFFPESRIWPAQ